MKRHVAFATALFLWAVAGLGAGCGAGQKYYEVTSHPTGGTIYVDEAQKGVTDEERLLVVFPPKGYVTLRVEKDGYQTEGVILSPELEGPIRFYLKERPRADEVLQQLEQIEVRLERMSTRLDQLRNE